MYEGPARVGSPWNFGIIHAKILRQSLAWPTDAESEVASADISCWSSLGLVGPPEPAARNLRSIRGVRGLTWFHEICTVMSTSALPVSGDCVVAPKCIDLSTDLCSTLQQDSCEQMRRCSASFARLTKPSWCAKKRCPPFHGVCRSQHARDMQFIL